MRLLELAVADLALIERARVRFRGGLVVITGETGAGKSLLIDALGLVLGSRADSGLVRSGAEAARVEAVFERDPEPLVCVRELAAGGRSLARIDDETVTAARLAATTADLVEIHGQHDQQRLLSGARQRDLLDAFGGHGQLRASVAEAVAALRHNAAALADLASAPGELERRIELLEHEAGEIEAAGLRPGEADELRASLAAVGNAEQLARLSGTMRATLMGEGSGVRDALARSAREGDELARLDARFGPLAGRLHGLVAEIDDLAGELRQLADAVEHDPAALAAMEERLGRIHALERKYGADEAAVLAHGEEARAEAERLRGRDAERAAREADAARLEADAWRLAGELRAARGEAAGRLAAAVTEALGELGFRQAHFEVRLEEAALESSGADGVAFVIAPNPGEPPLPLARIASGGELSRISLAVERVLAAVDTTPTLVFDEIDAGIGGRSAEPVGRSLWRLAREHQVLCITHLPQIAAFADQHLRIEKRQRDGRTVTEVRELDDEERRHELALMLGGRPGDAVSLAAAAELLARAGEARASLAAAG
ncbi:MAG TPA: DNA repair protein RecN [Candidatus Limnocylindrales bacterium]|nr:DNA repair protein RecN [Candidatus Limnocylindrales bacterium]